MDDHFLWEGPCIECLLIAEEVPVWDPCMYFKFGEEDDNPFRDLVAVLLSYTEGHPAGPRQAVLTDIS